MFSLVLATLNRTEEVGYFLKSLDAQTYRDFELIVIDQNSDDRLVSVLEPYQSKFAIAHLRSAKGLSLARNFGLKHLSGEIVAFPDDDCAYHPTTLEQVHHFFSQNQNQDGITGRPDGGSSIWDTQSGEITSLNLWRRGISYTIFLRRKVVEQVGNFDETLGVGAGTPWGSGEESDYLLRAIHLGYKIHYNPTLTVIHPVQLPIKTVPAHKSQKRDFSKTYAYAMGRGRLLRKHRYPLWFVVYNWLRPCAGLFLSIVKGRTDDVRSYWATLKGRFQGWLGVV